MDGEEYERTKGLWELIVSKNPNNEIYNDQDYNNYVDLLIKTDAIFQENDSRTNRPKASKSGKWIEIVRPIWEGVC